MIFVVRLSPTGGRVASGPEETRAESGRDRRCRDTWGARSANKSFNHQFLLKVDQTLLWPIIIWVGRPAFVSQSGKNSQTYYSSSKLQREFILPGIKRQTYIVRPTYAITCFSIHRAGHNLSNVMIDFSFHTVPPQQCA